MFEKIRLRDPNIRIKESQTRLLWLGWIWLGQGCRTTGWWVGLAVITATKFEREALRIGPNGLADVDFRSI